MIKKILFALFFVVIVSNLTSALDENLVPLIAKQGQTYDLQASCDLNGWFCNPTTICNLTMTAPNGTFMVYNERMSVNKAVVNYTLPTSDTQTSGRYFVDIKCNDALTGLNGSTDTLLIITPSGDIQTTGSAIISAVIMVAVLVLTIVFIILGFIFTKSKIWPISIVLFLIAWGFVAYVLYLSWVYNQNLALATNSTTIPENFLYIFWTLSTIGLFSLFLVMLWLMPKLYNKVIKPYMKETQGNKDGWDNNNYN